MPNDTCKHFKGLYAHGTKKEPCEAGVNVREITGGPDLGWFIRIPCKTEVEVRAEKPVERAKCPHFCLMTPEESAADEAEWEAIAAESERKMRASIPLIGRIKATNKGRSNSGADPCPACEGGTLHWRIARYNGHVHARCSTPGCISFME